MTPRDAAVNLLRDMKTPAWAASVQVRLEEDGIVLFVCIDPKYQLSLDLPNVYEGIPVRLGWMSPGFAYSS